MSRDHQDQHRRSTGYHPQSHFSIPQQSDQYDPPLSSTQDAYSSYAQGGMAYSPSSHQPSNYSPTGSTANYFPQQTTYNPLPGISHQDISGRSFPTTQSGHLANPQLAQPSDPYAGHQTYVGHERRNTYGGSAYSNTVSPVSGSVTGGAASYPGAQSLAGDYNTVDGQDWGTARHDEGNDDYLYDERVRGPPSPPVAGRPVIRFCRYPNCGRHGFYDHRVNTYMEWCRDHMPRTVANNLCVQCGIFPRQNGYSFCGGDRCQYTRQYTRQGP